MHGSNTIPFFGLDRQYQTLRLELLDTIDSVYKTGQVLDGPFTKQFEEQIANRTNRRYAVAVTSCSLALLISYFYYSTKYKDPKNVVLPAFSFIASANAPMLGEWKINFVDVDKNGLMNIDKIDNSNINIVSYVNLFGNILDYDKLRLTTEFFSKNITVIEDAAQSFGATYNGIPSGKLGTVSCLSFDPTKNLPNYGSGGMVLTDDYQLYLFALGYRNNGKAGITQYALPGSNCKMSESDCAQMIVKLKYFDGWQTRRTKIAEYYTAELQNYVACPTPNENVKHAWHKYVIQTDRQLKLKHYLAEYGIETKVHYSEPLIARSMVCAQNSVLHYQYPMAYELSNTCLSLPIYPELTDGEVALIIKKIKSLFN